jgi:hypothetical protein
MIDDADQVVVSMYLRGVLRSSIRVGPAPQIVELVPRFSEAASFFVVEPKIMEAFRGIQAAGPVVRVPGRTQEELDQPVAAPIAGPDAQPRSDTESSRTPSVLMPSVPKWSSPAFVDSGETVDTPRNSGVRHNFMHSKSGKHDQTN